MFGVRSGACADRRSDVVYHSELKDLRPDDDCERAQPSSRGSPTRSRLRVPQGRLLPILCLVSTLVPSLILTLYVVNGNSFVFTNLWHKSPQPVQSAPSTTQELCMLLQRIQKTFPLPTSLLTPSLPCLPQNRSLSSTLSPSPSNQ